MTRLLLVLSVLAALAGCAGVGNSGTTSGYVSGDGKITVLKPEARERLPELSGMDLDGKPLSTQTFAGKILVINLWGSWCNPCRQETPALVAVSQAYATKGVQFLGILTRDNIAAARAFESRNHIDYPSFAASGGRLDLKFVDTLPAQAIPTTWVIDAQGRVAARVLGKVTAATLSDLIDTVRGSR
jgi:thiol-disulfide isomerase/thioredoxin